MSFGRSTQTTVTYTTTGGMVQSTDADSLPLQPPASPVTQSTTQIQNADHLKIRVDGLKKRMKSKRNFEDAVPEFMELMKHNLSYQNKKLFYDSLNIVSHRVGKPGFEPAVAKPLFYAALQLQD